MANTFSVSNAEELKNALTSAKGGEIIELAGGDYGQLDLMTFKTFGIKAIYDTPVTITSADPNDRASFSGIDFREVKNLTFDNVVFDSNYTGSSVWASPFSISSSTDITIRNSLFEGELAYGTGVSTADGFATGKGLTVGGSSNVIIENNEFTTWHRGLVVGGSKDVSVIGNDVHSIRSDGMNFAQVQNVLIEKNHIHDFVMSKESGDHSDMIQFWTNGGTVPSTDIVIRGNTLDVGDGNGTQSIFMRNDMVDRGLAGEEMFYQNLLIEENVILNNGSHGISVGETNGLVIRKNSVLDADAENSASVATPKINLNAQSTNVVVEQNATAAINGHRDQPDWTVSDNALVQNTDPNAPGYYESEFVTSSISGEANGYVANPNGSIAQLEAGASRLQLDTSPDSLRTAFNVSTAPDAANSLVFDAGYTYGVTGNIAASDAQFIWDFGDGTGAIGQVVRHTYAEAGRFDATLTVMTPDGAAAMAGSEIGVMGADMLSFDPQTGFFQAEGYGEAAAIENSDKASVATGDGYGLNLGDQGSNVTVGKSDIARLFGAESFDMSMTLRADTPGSTGEVARIHGNFLLSVADRGEVSFRLWTDEGSTKLTTTRFTVNDGDDHDIHIAFDGAAGRLEIHIDGALATATEVDGVMRGDYPRNLDFGNPWGKQNFDGTLTAFDLAVENQDYPDYEGQVVTVPDNAVPVSDLPDVDAGADEPAQSDTQTTEPPMDDPTVPNNTTDPDGSDAQDNDDAPTDDSATQDRTETPAEPLYRIDFAQFDTDESGINLSGDAHVSQNTDGSAKVVLDGHKDYVGLGRIEALETTQQLGISLNFQRSDVDSGAERMVWNHMKFGIAVKDDSLLIHVANNDRPFHKAFEIGDAGIDNTEKHSLNVVVDAEADRLQVVLDGNVVLDEQDTDLDFVGAGGHEWGWSIGTAWNRFYEGSVSEFELDDQAVFVDDTAALL